MIPISYRLNAAAEKKYIDQALQCIKPKKIYTYWLIRLLVKIRREGWPVANLILTRAQRFKTDYPSTWVLCEWLVMPYEELMKVKEYLDSIVRTDLDPINAEIERTRARIVKIKNYHDLRSRQRNAYATHKKIGNMIKNATQYKDIYDKFQMFITFYDKWSQNEINGWIIEKTGLKVCPYCNIMYTYNRERVVTAQLDHFFPKAEYPVLSLCFYNLVPSCPACNKLKRDNTEEMASPYRDGAFRDLRFTWAYDGEDKYGEMDSLAVLEDRVKIMIETSRADEKRNLTCMQIYEAYRQHRDYASEAIKKARTYTNLSAQKLICAISSSVGVTPADVERFYLGNYLTENDLKKRPLSKMVRDFYLEINRAKGRP